MPEKHAGLQSLEPLIFVFREQRVMLDADLAHLYGVGTKRFNEAFKRNRRRFPEDFAFRLSAEEFGRARDRARVVVPQVADSTDVRANWLQFATSSSRRRIGFHADD